MRTGDQDKFSALDFCVCFFTSTKGHFKNKTIYKHTLENLEKDLASTTKIFVHIKVTPGEEEIANNMAQTITSIFPDAQITQTVGQWNHVDGSSHYEYLKDIHTLFEKARYYNYALFLEDDWLFNNNAYVAFYRHNDIKLDFREEMRKAKGWLKGVPEIFCYRWLRDDPTIDERTDAKKDFGGLLYSQNKEFSFNPCVIRPKEMFLIASFVVKMYNHLHPHCEMAVTQAINFLFNEKAKFVFEMQESVTHIGTQEFVNSITNEKS
jgi:hypothetical protein